MTSADPSLDRLMARVGPTLCDPAAPPPAADGATPAVDAAALLARSGAPALVVTGADGAPLGLARAIDLLDPPAGASLADVTPPLGDALAPTDSLLDALRLMRLRGADLLPVVADGGAVVGLVTARTLLDGLAPVVDGLLDNATAALFGPPPS